MNKDFDCYLNTDIVNEYGEINKGKRVSTELQTNTLNSFRAAAGNKSN